MATEKQKKALFEHIDMAELELLRSNAEYARAFLQEEGFDIDEELNFSAQYLKKIKFKAAAMAKKQKDLRLLEAAYQRLKEAIRDNSTKTGDKLMFLLQSKRPAMQYRKLDKWTDDEIREVLTDVDLLKLMEELSKED